MGMRERERGGGGGSGVTRNELENELAGRSTLNQIHSKHHTSLELAAGQKIVDACFRHFKHRFFFHLIYLYRIVEKNIVLIKLRSC